MSDQRFRYVSRSDQRKLERIAERLRAIVKRDGTERTFEGVHDYMIRAVIEAMELGDLFYEFEFRGEEKERHAITLPVLRD